MTAATTFCGREAGGPTSAEAKRRSREGKGPTSADGPTSAEAKRRSREAEGPMSSAGVGPRAAINK
jgi:hypothetical protein